MDIKECNTHSQSLLEFALFLRHVITTMIDYPLLICTKRILFLKLEHRSLIKVVRNKIVNDLEMMSSIMFKYEGHTT